MNIITLKAPTAEPLNVAEAKAHVVQSQSMDDQLITDKIAAARQFVEDQTWKRMMLQTVVISLDNWTGYCIDLPIAPLITVTGITYVDTSGVTQTLSPSIYQVNTRSHLPRITPVLGQIWPPVQLLTDNAIQITCVVGFAAPLTTSGDTVTLNVTDNPWANGTILQLYNSGGALPTGLKANTNYYVVNSTANSLQLSLTLGGSAVAYSDAGSGSNYIGIVPRRLREAMLLYVGLFYNHREAAIVDNRAAEVEIPWGLQSIVDAEKLQVF